MTYTISDFDLDKSSLAVITDLDGTLLDFDTYSFDPAIPALSKLRKMNIPVICCSSKTRDEIVYWRGRLKITDPFICENGASVLFPKKHFTGLSNEMEIRDSYIVKTFGTSRKSLRSVFEEVRDKSGVAMTGFSDMTVAEIGILCGFKSYSDAQRASSREHSEPFVFDSGVKDVEIERVLGAFSEAGLHIIRGRRFYHLTGKVNKGLAVEFLREAYLRAHQKKLTLVGIGDSKNDIEMLRSVELPFLVMGKNRRYDRMVKETVRPILAGAPGPSGFYKAIELILSRIRS